MKTNSDTRNRSSAVLPALLLVLFGPPSRAGAAMADSWTLAGRCCGVGCASGRCVRQCLPLRGTLELAPDGYRAPGDPCPFGGEPGPDELGTVRPGRRGALVLEPSNPEELADGARACLAQRFDVESLELRSRRARVRLRPDGRALRGLARTRIAAVVSGRRLSVTLVCRFRSSDGTPVDAPGAMGPGAVVPLAVAGW